MLLVISMGSLQKALDRAGKDESYAMVIGMNEILLGEIFHKWGGSGINFPGDS